MTANAINIVDFKDVNSFLSQVSIYLFKNLPGVIVSDLLASLKK
jgi:hypothetical protein